MFLNKKFIVNLRSDLFLFLNKNIFLFIGPFGYIRFYLYNFFFWKRRKNGFSFIFFNRQIYVSFLKYFIYVHRHVSTLFFFKLRLRGLGFRIKKLTSGLFKFFLARNHFYYFYIPINMYIKNRRRHFYVLSFNKSQLNDIFSKLLLLKKMDFYNRGNSFIMKNKILFLKK